MRGCAALRYVAAAVLSCTAVSGWAEQPAYETTVHGSRPRRTASDDPAAFVTIIDIDDPPPGTDLSDLLADVPGLRIRETGIGGRQTLSLRGAAAHQVAVFLDGIRLTPPGGGGVDLALIDPAHLEVAEVRRSGGSARFGEDALGGALLLRTPRLRQRTRTRAAVGYGSFATLVARGAHGAAWGRLRYLVSGSLRRSTGEFPYVDGNGVPRRRHNNDSQLAETLLKIDHPNLGGWHLTLLDSFGWAARGAPGMSQWPSTTARQRDIRNVAAVQLSRYDLLLRGDRLTFSAHQRYGFFRFDEPAPPPVLSRNHRIGVGGGAVLELPLPGVGRMDGGVELRAELFRDAALESQPQRIVADVWLAGQLGLLGQHVVLAPAVRVAAASAFSTQVVPKAGLVVRPLRSSARPLLRAVELTANVGRRYRLPSFEELYVRLDGFGGNPQLRPEDALAVDGGLRWRSTALSVEAAYFRRWMKNTILFAPISPVMVRADNYSAVLAHGLELAAALQPGLCLALRAAYTHTRASFGEPASQLPGQPRHRLAGRVGWAGQRCAPAAGRRAIGRWLAGLRVWAAAAVDSAMVLGRFDSLREEGRLLLSAGIAYRYGRARLAAEGRNLLDNRNAVDSVGFPLAPARFFVSLGVGL